MLLISSYLYGDDISIETRELLNNSWMSIGIENDKAKTSYNYQINFLNEKKVNVSREDLQTGEIKSIIFNYTVYDSGEFISFSKKEIWLYDYDPEIAFYILYYENGWKLISPMAISTSWEPLILLDNDK